MNKILLSIIIPAYNASKYIGDLFDSIIKQSRQNIDVFVIDDGSTDSTLNVIKSYYPKFHNNRIPFKFKTRNNKGVSQTVSELLKMADGEYFLQIDSDDVLYDGAIDKMLQIIKCCAPDIILSSLDFYNEDLTELKEKQTYTKNKKIVKDYLLKRNVHFTPNIIKFDSFKNKNNGTDIFPGKEGQNYQLILPVLVKKSNIFIYQESFIKYRVRNSSHSHSTKTFDERVSREYCLFETVKQTLKRINDKKISHYHWNKKRLHNKICEISIDYKNKRTFFNHLPFCSFLYIFLVIRRFIKHLLYH